MNRRRMVLCMGACLAALAGSAWRATGADASASGRPADAQVNQGAAVCCANLVYAGTRSSVCFSDQFLSIIARDSTIQTVRKFRSVKLADAEIFQYPFCIMTGEGAFSLTDGERVNLRRYLERGGFLLASAGCSSKEWDASFRRELAGIFPDRALADIPLTHEIFNTVYPIGRLSTKHADASLHGLVLDRKTVLIYSPDGLNDTATMHGCCCCGGNEIANAQQVNVNILAYALLQ